MRYAAELVARGVPVRYGVEPVRVEGRRARHGRRLAGARDREADRLRRARLRARTAIGDPACRPRRLPFHLRQTRSGLASGARCSRAHQRCAASISPETAPELRALTRRNLPASALAGPCCEEAGLPVDTSRIRVLEQKSAALDRFRSVLESAFPFPDSWAEKLADDVVLCRCEEIAVGRGPACGRRRWAWSRSIA